MTTIAADKTTMKPQSPSLDDIISKIQSLNTRAKRLNEVADFWNRWNVRAVAGAAVIAAAVFATQFTAIKRTREYAQVESELSETKDERLAIESRLTTLEIADAHAVAGNASARAATVERQNLLIKAELTESNRVLEAERMKRVEIEKSLAPRSISFKEFSDGTTNIDALKSFAGVEVLIEYIPDVEAQRTAANIKFLLDQAGWKVISFGATAVPMFDGVTVLSYLASPPFVLGSQSVTQMGVSQRARMSLWRVLRENGWIANVNSASSVELKPGPTAPGQVKVKVGFKPPMRQLSASEKAEQDASDARDGVVRNRPPKAIIREILVSPAGIDRYVSGPPPKTP